MTDPNGATDGLGDGRRICEALGFDPTNHHNALKCPYCNDLAAPEQRIAELESQVALWRDCFEEITAKATPYGRDDPIKCYIIPAGPLHRAAGKTGCQAFNLDANFRATLAEYERAMIEEVIPAIEANERARALAAIELRFPRRRAVK